MNAAAKRTWVNIHETALRLARQHGMRGSTVEDIAAEAGISPRTFFNYFGTKEDAVLGLRAPAITDELLASDWAHENDNLIVRITHLLLYIVPAQLQLCRPRQNSGSALTNSPNSGTG